MNRIQAKYNPNLLSGKIRRLLKRNPNAGYEDLKKVCKRVDHSIRVMYYNIHKEMYGNPGTLKRNIKKPAPLRDQVRAYFDRYPNHTIDEAAKAMSMTRHRVYGAIYSAKHTESPIPFRKKHRGTTEISVSKSIREYFVKHPKATTKTCARALGAKPEYVSLIIYRARRDGL